MEWSVKSVEKHRNALTRKVVPDSKASLDPHYHLERGQWQRRKKIPKSFGIGLWMTTP